MAERWLTYQQAGDALGMSAEAARQRARRLGWRTQPGNEGRALVLVPDGMEVRPRRPPVQPPGQPPVQTAEAAELVELRERAARAEGESATLREQVESERGRAGRAEAERDAARAEASAERARAAQAEREREEARIRAAAAEGEAKGLREALAEARRPFWRRWLG